MKKITNKLIPLLMSSILLSVSLDAGAIEEMDDFFSMSPEQLANISVTVASGTAKPIYQAAAVTSVITAQQIKTMGATELSQILDTIPGLHVSIQAVTNDPIYSMRGIRNDVNNQILVLMNGTRFSVPYKGSFMTGMDIPVAAIQRVEVIRGPGSALYGADAFSGVINIITKKAKDIDGTEIGGRVGRWDTQSVWGMHGDQWLGWDVATTLQYTHNNNDSDRTIASDLQSQFDDSLGTNASLSPSEMEVQVERWNAHLNLERKYWDINFWVHNAVDGGLRAGAGGSLDDEGLLDAENYLTDLHFSSEDLINDWELFADANYLYTNIDAELHNFPDGTRLPIDTNGMINPSTPAILSHFPDGALTLVGIENQVVAFDMGFIYKGIDDHLLRLSSGFRYEQVSTKEHRNFGVGILDGTQAVVDGTLTDVTGTDLVFLPDSHRSIWSVSLQDEWQIAADWQLTTGIRYDEYSDFGSTVNPRVALVWDVSRQLSSKLLYGQAFRAPSFLEQKQQNSQLFIGDPSVEPETIETVELAFDYRPTQDLRLASNFYYYQIEDMIAASGTGVATVANNEGQTGYGAEFEWDWRFHQQWDLKGNYAWQYARNEETKRRVVGVPEHQVYVAANWQFMPQWELQTQINWVGHRLALSGTNDDLKDYQTVDITLNSRRFFGYVDFSASAHNVFDSNGKEPATTSYRENLPIASRSFYLQTTIHF